MRRPRLLAWALLAPLLLAALAAAQGGVVRYSSEEVVAGLAPWGVRLHISYVIVNRGDEPIVPGYAYLRLSARAEKKLLGIIPIPGSSVKAPISLGNVKVLVAGKPVEYTIYGDGYATVLKYNVWKAVPPGGSLRVNLTLDARGLVADGLLFRDYSFTLQHSGEAAGRVEVALQPLEGWLCYANPPPGPGGRILFVDLKPGSSVHVEAEVSKYIPMPLLPVKGSTALWTLAIILAAAFLAYRRIRGRRRRREEW